MMRVLFLCSGNICRSPLAAALAAARWPGDVACESAGLGAARGDPASDGSRAEAAARGLDLERHRSRPLDDVDLARFDWVIAMTPAQAATFRARVRGWRGRLGLLGLPGVDLAHAGGMGGAESVDDPYRVGTGPAYAQMARQIERLLAAWNGTLSAVRGHRRSEEGEE